MPHIFWAEEEWRDLASLQDELAIIHLKRHVEVLGSDLMAGRATGSTGERLAADYIRSKLLEYNISPALNRRSYIQNIPLHGSTPLPTSELLLHHHENVQRFHLGEDYLLFNTGAQTFLPKPLPLVFVGYGIVAPEYDYNDYQNIDVAGKIVVYLSGEPMSDDPDYFHGRQPTIYSYADSKERIAISRGARGCLLIDNPFEDNTRWQQKRNAFLFEDVKLAYSATDIFSALLNPMAASALFHRSPYSLQDILRRPDDHVMSSFELEAKLSFRGHFQERDFFSRNIVAEVRGTDVTMRDQYLILSAHYDHLGIGAPVRGDSIYNGVVDNAMGCAALLEIARALKLSPPKRSVLFLFFTGEEKGLLGSTYYIDNPVVPLYKTVAAINIDGLAIFDTFRDIIGFGSELSSLRNSLEKSASVMGLTVSELPPNFSRIESFARSDQISFAKAGVPTMIVMDGVHYDHLDNKQGIKKHIEWMQKIYHSPFDDLNQPIHWNAVEQHCRFLLTSTWFIANDSDEPTWLPGTPYINARLQSIAEKK